MGKIAQILEMLNDGQWHMLEGIQQKMMLNKRQIQQITAFLEEYEFIAVDDTRKEIKLEEAARKFLVQNATS